MHYVDTRAGEQQVSASQAIVQGISKKGGLFVPTFFPQIDLDFIKSLCDIDYKKRAQAVLSLYLTEFAAEKLTKMVENAYGMSKFTSQGIAPVVKGAGGQNVLELWHGPTLAFKDMALQLLPHLMMESAKSMGENREIVILVATSGDTGKAALEGFADVKGTRCTVFYPKEGVSEAQRLQMLTQQGNNVSVIAVQGNFDDAQTGVKKIFTDVDLAQTLAEKGIALSSANSINWGRLVPQIVYYFSAYADCINNGTIALGDALNFVVPTGNFGNILAGIYAKHMGLPIGHLVCASNRNNVLSDFLRTGVYDARREFFKTSSPSMDILISSNLERLLFELCDRDGEKVSEWMGELNTQGHYTLGPKEMERMRGLLWGSWADDTDVEDAIRETWRNERMLIDPHTAVAMNVLDQYTAKTGDKTPSVVVSTANPYKFGRDVGKALLGREQIQSLNDFECCDRLEQYTGVIVPKSIRMLQQKPVLHKVECTPETMKSTLLNELHTL